MEEWRYITELSNRYAISNLGRVKATKTDKIRKPKTDNDGYKLITFRISKGKAKNYFIHRLLLMTFNPIQDMHLYDVHHKDRNRGNNILNNVIWMLKSDHNKMAKPRNEETISSLVKQLKEKYGDGLKDKIKELLLQ